MKALILRVSNDCNFKPYIREFGTLEDIVKFMRHKREGLMLSFPTRLHYEEYIPVGETVDIIVTIHDDFMY